MTINNFEIDKDLRRDFKIICASNDISMKEAMLEEALSIIEKNEDVSRFPTGPKETIGHFMVNIDDDVKNQMVSFCKDNNYFIRDLVMTAITNIIDRSRSYP